MTKTCIVCGKEFVPSGRHQVTCSPECRKPHRVNTERARIQAIRAQLPQRIVTCVICGKQFPPKASTHKTCSHECKLAWRTRLRRVSEWEKQEHVCIVCGKTFKRKYRTSRAITCSIECSKVNSGCRSRISRAIRKTHALLEVGNIKPTKEVICLRCGEPFQSKAKDNRICSRCQNINELLDARTYAPLYEIAIHARARRASA